jgi:phenylacetate-coenzyme A ligase PaaK-like adenylate-forming protein
MPTAEGMQTVVIAAGAPLDEVLAGVVAAQPTHLVGYPSVIGRLARAALAGDLRIKPVRVSTNSEPLLDEDREAIVAAWDPAIHNVWGSTEIGVQAVGCGYGQGLHVCEDEVILERVDDAGTPVSPDRPAARTLATGLANRTFPFIRYDLGDQVLSLGGSCACGSVFARIADVGGRRDDDFRYGPILIPPIAFRHVLGTDPRVSEYQVAQTTTGADIFIVGAPDLGALTTALTAALREYGLPEPAIQIRAVDSLQRHQASGKLRRFIPL